MLKDLIENKENILDKIIRELKDSKIPTILYGAGGTAKRLYNFLNTKINIDYIAVSDDYYQDGLVFFDKKIYSIENLLSNNENVKMNIILAFSSATYVDLDKCLNSLKTKMNVNNIYLLDSGGIIQDPISFTYIMEHIDEYQKTYDLLEDDLSKNFMVDFLNIKITNDISYFLKKDYMMIEDKYWQKDIIKLEDNEVYVECGAYDGEVIEEFIEDMKINNKKYSKIFAIEADSDNFTILKEKFDTNCNVICVNKAVSNKKCKLKLEFAGTSAAKVVEMADDITDGRDSNNIIDADTLDNIIGDERVTLIAMDIEGSELEALQGAKNIIKKYKPRLCISAYHKEEDLYTITSYIKNICPEYKIYMRALYPFSFDFTIFAII